MSGTSDPQQRVSLAEPSTTFQVKRGGKPAVTSLNQAQLLVTTLRKEMADAWEQGQFISTEDYLESYPGLDRFPEVALRLVQLEARLAHGSDASLTPTELVQRFPQWADQLSADLRPDARFDDWSDVFPDVQILGELGRGATGCVLLATQPGLADRPLVLKITSCTGQEHLSLARLQHTHIVPLYWVRDLPQENLRALAMPFLGGVTWRHILDGLADTPFAERTAEKMARFLDQSPLSLPGAASKRPALEKNPVRFICRLGICLAQALEHAHQRELIHLDIKPGNILITDDGEPMLLDFHLARAPLRVGGPRPGWLGGTPGYMSPEHQQAFAAINEGLPLTADVDARADVFSLGAVLYEALAGFCPVAGSSPPLHRINRLVSVGLSDIVQKCLHPQPEARYQSAGALAADLQRHLENQPLRGVRNRSWRERWRKWQRRRPLALPLLCLAFCLMAMVGLLGGLFWHQQQTAHHRLEKMLLGAQVQMRNRAHGDAVRTLQQGLTEAKGLLGGSTLVAAFQQHLHLAQRSQKTAELHQLAEALRLLYLLEGLPRRLLVVVDAGCEKLWAGRETLLRSGNVRLETSVEHQIREDLLDLAICWCDLRTRLAPPTALQETHCQALETLQQAAELLGQSPILREEMLVHARAVNDHSTCHQLATSEFLPLRTSWEHYARARRLLRQGELVQARQLAERAAQKQPNHFWSALALGIYSFRAQRYQEALSPLSQCVGHAPDNPHCLLLRGQCQAALGQYQSALADFNQALELQNTLAEAYLQRGKTLLRLRRGQEALADLQRAQLFGLDSPEVRGVLSQIQLALAQPSPEVPQATTP